jgi:hypothetical protein
VAGGMIHYVRVLETRPIDTTVRRWREIRKGTMEVMGRHWHQHMLPQHFEPNAPNVYHFHRRTTKYLEQKRKAAQRGRMGARAVDRRAGTDFLTFTGVLRANVTQFATIRVFEQRFKLVMPGTPYTPDRPRRPGQPPIAQEVTKLLEREKEELARLGKAFAKEAMQQKTQTSVTELR